MMRLYTLAAFASTASALHLAGPMDDRLTACAAAVRAQHRSRPPTPNKS
jgi:hypothetical protein